MKKEQKKITCKQRLQAYEYLIELYIRLFGKLDFKNYDIVKFVKIADRLKPYRDKIIDEYEKNK